MKKVMFAGLLFLSVGATTRVAAQGCSVCTKTAAGLDNESASGLNKGIIYLAFLPLGIMCTVGYLWWRSRR